MNKIKLISGRCYEIEQADGTVVIGKFTDTGTTGAGTNSLFEIPPGGSRVDVYGNGGRVREGKVKCGDGSDSYPPTDEV